METTFNCPKCGAPLQNHGADPIITCSYCHSSVVVPDNLREKPNFTSMGGGLVIPGGRSTGSIGEMLKKAIALKEVKDLAQQGREVEATRKFQEITGQDLESSSEAVRQLANGQPITLGALDDKPQNLSGLESGNGQTIDIDSKAVVLAPIFISLITQWIGYAFVAFAIVLVVFGTMLSVYGEGNLQKIVNGQVNKNFPILATVVPQLQKVAGPTPTPSYGAVLSSFGEKGTKLGQFNDMRWVTTNPLNGLLFTADYSDGRIMVFEPGTGMFIRQWQVEKNPVGGDSYISGLVADKKGNVWVSTNGRLYQYDPTGKLLTIVEGDGFLSELAISPDGRLFTIDGDTIRIFSEAGDHLGDMGSKISDATKQLLLNGPIVFGPDGTLYFAVGGFDCSVYSFTQDGTLKGKLGGCGQEPGQLHAPEAVAADEQGNIYVGDFEGIQVFGKDGVFINRIDVKSLSVPFSLVVDKQGVLWGAFSSQKIASFKVQ